MKILLALFLLLSVYFLPADQQQLFAVSKSLIQGTVPTLTTSELADTLAKKKILLLDTRTKKEFEVSHLPNAQWVGYDHFEIGRLAKVEKNTSIIVYCSVGYRSEKIGEKLKKAGYANVSNLFGGLFAWANESRPLEDITEKPTHKVHGYDAAWAKFLSPKITIILD